MAKGMDLWLLMSLTQDECHRGRPKMCDQKRQWISCTQDACLLWYQAYEDLPREKVYQPMNECQLKADTCGNKYQAQDNDAQDSGSGHHLE